MSEPRLRPLTMEEATGTQRLLIQSAQHNGAPDPLCAQIYARSEAGRNWLRQWNELLNGGIVPVALKEMCRVLISLKHGCSYCSSVKARIAYESGLTEEKLMATIDFETSPLFDERERAALRFATLFKSSDDAIDSDEVYDDLKKHFSEEEIIELALLCAETDGVGKFARSLRMRSWDEACTIQPRLQKMRAAVQAAE
ncbi:carboxymuconolactone decarboxylase family protein [Bradyrhizobium mercantei]|uniref:carboxymuconolactone decarboxylase family protein n=1 Tax=Bradyrhizobium mercantei TaxID=1904807 RepID=UPI0009F99E7A|nr:carboxymuconolactone decarboxylase family protein [Bradyrhizobium mercantei]